MIPMPYSTSSKNPQGGGGKQKRNCDSVVRLITSDPPVCCRQHETRCFFAPKAECCCSINTRGRMDNKKRNTTQPCRRSDGWRSLIHHSACLRTAVRVQGWGWVGGGVGGFAEQTAEVRWWLFKLHDVFRTSHVHATCACVCIRGVGVEGVVHV